jgi:hypothetical protein
MQPEAASADAAPEGPKRFGAKDVTDLTWKNLMELIPAPNAAAAPNNAPLTKPAKFCRRGKL